MNWRIVNKRWTVILVLGALPVLLSGCVTESSGGLPTPASDTERLKAQLDLARGYMEARDWSSAHGPLNRALKIDRRSVEALGLKAVLYEAEGEIELASQHYRQALSIDSADAQTLNNYGTFLYRQKRYDEALPPLRKLVRDTSYHARAQAYENLGLVELKLELGDEARESFDRALDLNPAQPRSHLELAAMALADADIRLAQAHYDEFRRQARQNARSLCLGMQLAERQRDANQRESYALALRNLYPNSREAQSCLTKLTNQ